MPKVINLYLRIDIKAHDLMICMLLLKPLKTLKENSGSSPWNGYCLGSSSDITPHSLLDPMAFSNVVDVLANNKKC